jgi:formamidopyrimidine-DNA glycosylase
MPELPEVETIKCDLEQVVINKTIIEVIIRRKSVIKQPSVDRFKQIITGSKIIEIIRRGKLLVFKIEDKNKQIVYLAVHLRMTGQLVYGTSDPKTRVVFKLSNRQNLCYNDQRCLGELRLVEDWTKLNVVLNMGPEPLGPDFESDSFYKKLKKRTTKIKPLLLDQHFIAGIGNIYACEALFLSKINPNRRACDLKKTEILALHKNIKQVLAKAIHCRGSSFSNYRDGHGQKGTFSDNFYVYGRKGQDCLICKNKIQRITIGGRGTFYCSKCQR